MEPGEVYCQRCGKRVCEESYCLEKWRASQEKFLSEKMREHRYRQKELLERLHEKKGEIKMDKIFENWLECPGGLEVKLHCHNKYLTKKAHLNREWRGLLAGRDDCGFWRTASPAEKAKRAEIRKELSRLSKKMGDVLFR